MATATGIPPESPKATTAVTLDPSSTPINMNIFSPGIDIGSTLSKSSLERSSKSVKPDRLPKKEITNITNIPNVEKYVPGIKLSSVSGKEKEVGKLIITFPRSDKETKSPDKKTSSLHKHDSDYSSSSSSVTLYDKSGNNKKNS